MLWQIYLYTVGYRMSAGSVPRVSFDPGMIVPNKYRPVTFEAWRVPRILSINGHRENVNYEKCLYCSLL